MNLIAKKIIETRKAKGLTQEELAEKSQVNLRTIQRIENRKNVPREKTLHLICAVLEINLEEIISDKKNSATRIMVGTKILNLFFLLILNLTLMGIIGFLTLDSDANTNSIFGGFLLSFFLPFFIVFVTKEMTGSERLLKFGFGHISYFILVTTLHGFSVGFGSGLFLCLAVSLTVLYFGDNLKISMK